MRPVIIWRRLAQVLVACCVAFAGSMTSAAPSTLAMGSLVLQSCRAGLAYCGVMDRALDPDGRISGRIPVYFEFYWHQGAGPVRGTLVATEGGPGYPATESRGDYLALFAPLRADHDVILMDNRGTGRSGAIDCPELQKAPAWTIENVARCGALLGERAPFYGTAYAADDLAAILDALRIARVDLYGDSYGTYFEQVFAARHPTHLHSLVLDGAYPLDGPDYPWYPTYAPAMRDKFNIACRRSPPCAALPGSSIDHILPVLQQLRAQPDGLAATARLAIVMFGSAPALATVRELDAAARAFLAKDLAPLQRLMQETAVGVDSRDPSGDPTRWSAGLAAAVMCHDPPQIFDMRLAPALRAADRDRALAQRRLHAPDTYAPFTIDEYRAMPLDYSFLDQCVAWPGPAGEAMVPAFADIPALVISGELDNMTTVADGAAVAHSFKRGRQIVIANGFHVNALPRGRSECAAVLVRRFITTLETGDASCAAQVPPLRLVPQFARHAAQVEPAAALPGNRAGTEQLRWVHAAVMTAGDVLARLSGNSTEQGVGLRGGRFRVLQVARAVRVALIQVRWTEDLAVSGSIDNPEARSGIVHALLQLATPDGLTGEITVEWSEGIANSMATIHGRVAGAVVAARTAAP
ncbi:MAG: alpha/beta fold hydrolase [Steroidobacterales bacterium]